jgi:hypothetical protein
MLYFIQLAKYIFSKKRNVLVDNKATPIQDTDLFDIYGIPVKIFNCSTEDLQVWIDKAELMEFNYLSPPQKKVLEFFFSFKLLEISDFDCVLDAAGGESRYLVAVKKHIANVTLILQDHIYANITNKHGIKIIGGDISDIKLPDASIDKIACHHAFEHFKGNKDQLFVKEIARLIKPTGKAVIIPIFISTGYYECWNTNTNMRFDDTSTLLLDVTSTLPGGDGDGHFARVYNPAIFKKRICDYAEKLGLNWTLVTCTINNENVPNMNTNKGAKINNPLRALVVTKKQHNCE